MTPEQHQQLMYYYTYQQQYPYPYVLITVCSELSLFLLSFVRFWLVHVCFHFVQQKILSHTSGAQNY